MLAGWRRRRAAKQELVVAAKLRATAAYLQNQGWMFGTLGTDGGPRCLLGAMMSVERDQAKRKPMIAALGFQREGEVILFNDRLPNGFSPTYWRARFLESQLGRSVMKSPAPLLLLEHLESSAQVLETEVEVVLKPRRVVPELLSVRAIYEPSEAEPAVEVEVKVAVETEPERVLLMK